MNPAERDWFSLALAGGRIPDLETFEYQVDARFPYFDEIAWRAAIELAPLVSPWAEWHVLYEILVPPASVALDRDHQLAMLEAWAKRFGREPASTFLSLGREIVARGEISPEHFQAARSAVENDEGAHWTLDSLASYLPWSRAESFRAFLRRVRFRFLRLGPNCRS